MIYILARALPYIAVGFGLYILKNGWISILLYHTGMTVFLLHAKKRPPFKSLLEGWHKIWAWMIPVGALGGVAIYLLWPWMRQELDLAALLPEYGLTGWRWTLFLFYYSLIHPPLEQFYWRGYLGHPSRQLIPEDILFAGYHFFTMICFVQWHWALVSCMLLTGTAYLWRQSVRESGGLRIAALSHLLADVSVIWMVNALL